MLAVTTAGTWGNGMDIGRLALVLGIWSVGVGCLAMGLWNLRWKRRLRARGVEVDAVRTGRRSSGNEYASASYEVRFTTVSGETMTAWVRDSSDVQRVVYDPEEPVTIRRRGPISFRYGPMSVSNLDSLMARVGDLTWVTLGVTAFAGGLGALTAP